MENNTNKIKPIKSRVVEDIISSVHMFEVEKFDDVTVLCAEHIGNSVHDVTHNE